jgi:HlyD family secretion protein
MTVGSDNRVKRVIVQTGARGEGLVTLVRGPPAGTRVIQNAAAFLLDGDLVRPIRTTLKAPVAKAAASAGPASR